MTAAMKGRYPWVKSPVIVNGPMGGFAGPSLAAEVTAAGGFGFIGSIFDMGAVDTDLEETKRLLQEKCPDALHGHSTLPVGVGFLLFIADRPAAIKVIAKHKPRAVWMFAAGELSDYAVWAREVRGACPGTDIWVQTCSVAAAVEIARTCQPDVLVMQGADAGGHGYEKGSGIVSLLPEAADALQAKGFGHIPLMAAGGMVDGRGVAAAVALGAAGTVMGTRFLASEEVVLPHPGYQAAVLQASDGGQSTVRHKVFDEMFPKGNTWPVLYDGRGLVNLTYTDAAGGLSVVEVRKLYAAAGAKPDKGFVVDETEGGMRGTVWAGTGVGLVKDVKAAGEIVREAREGALRVMAGMKSVL